VGGPKTRGLRRGIAFAAVVALHAGLVILTVAFRTPTSPSASTEFITALIFLTAPLPPVASSNRRRPQVASQTSPVAPVEPPTTPPPVKLSARCGYGDRLGRGGTACCRCRDGRTESQRIRSEPSQLRACTTALMGCRRSWRVPSLQGRCVRAIRSLGATCSKTCRRTGSITRSRRLADSSRMPRGKAGGRLERRPPALCLLQQCFLLGP
jgi:hypothetical protein